VVIAMPRLVLAAAHKTFPAEEAINPVRKTLTPSERTDRTLVRSVELDTDGASNPNGAVVDETTHE
jgi:hypothetical protein